MLPNFSEASFGTSGTGTTKSTWNAQVTEVKTKQTKSESIFWKGRLKKITLFFVNLPWNYNWQLVLCGFIVVHYIINLMLLNSMKDKMRKNYYIIRSTSEFMFFIDVVVCYLHRYCQELRGRVTIYRRNIFFLTFDAISLVPWFLIYTGTEINYYFVTLSRILTVCRIYRVYMFQQLTIEVTRYRKLQLFTDNILTIVVLLHTATCIMCSIKNYEMEALNGTGYPSHVESQHLRFDKYGDCLYYCGCYMFNTILGDTYSKHSPDRWLTIITLLAGFVIIRYRFIGNLTYIFSVENMRRSKFADRYCHMCTYLEQRGAPRSLVENAKKYQDTLWEMKDGALTSAQIKSLPSALQMELIFDINVGYFHRTLLFRETDDTFIRQISLLMEHHIYLEDQIIWNQGVVKCGMICIKKGVVELLSDEDDESPMIAFNEGTILGELSLFYSIPAKVSVRAASYVEVQVLNRTDFLRNVSEHLTVFQQLRSKIKTRLNTARTIQRDIIEYDKGDSRLIRSHYRPMKALKNYLAGVEGEDPIFVDDSHMYYRDQTNVRRPKFIPDFCELYNLSINLSNIEMPKICLKPNFPWILEADTSFTKLLDVTHFIIVLYVCILWPYIALHQEEKNNYSIMATIAMFGLILNIYSQLTTAIIYKDVRKETMTEIAEEKMASFGFYFDILSVFPYNIFTDILDPTGETSVGLIQYLIPVLQAWHLWDYLTKWEKKIVTNRKLCIFLKFGIFLGLGCYWTGILLYLYTCPNDFCVKKSWLRYLRDFETTTLSLSMPLHINITITSVYFGTSLFTNSGSSGIWPGPKDVILVVAFIIIGFYLHCVYTSQMCSICMLSTYRITKFKETMRDLFYFLTVNQVSNKIRERVHKFFCVQWYYNNAITTKELFQDVSADIKQEVLYIEMVETLMRCTLFQDCSSDFLHSIAANSTSLVLPDHETVMHAADIGRDMYIIQEGYCNIRSNQGKVVRTIGPGSDFGSLEMLYGLPKVHTVTTATNCILLHIDYSTLIQCWSTFPDDGYPIYNVLENAEILNKVKEYETPRPLTTKMDAKINRIAQEIKESFVFLSSRKEKKEYKEAFNNLGIFRYLQYIIVPASITPHGLFLKIWCLLRFIIAAYYITLIPYYLAVNDGSLFNFNYCDIFLYLDLLVMAYVAYYNEKNLLVTHPLYTIKNYLRKNFILDVLIAFPFEKLLIIVNITNNSEVPRLNKLLQVTRIAGLFHYLEENIMSTTHVLVYFKYLPYALTIVNFATAYIIFKTCTISVNNNVYMATCFNTATHISKLGVGQVAFSVYMQTFYCVFQLFFGCGCFIRSSTTAAEAIIFIIISVTGYFYFALVFGYVASSARIFASNSLLKHKEGIKDLENFLYQENVDPIFITKTMKYFEYVWKRTNGSNPQQICRKLNSALMEDTLVFMYEKTLREVPLFSNVERSFIRVITQHLSEMYFLKGETVIQCRDIQPNIFIIYRGKVDVLSSFNEMVTCMGPGGMFGNFTGKAVACADVSIYASRTLDLLVIPTQTFFRLVKCYPKIQEPLNKAFTLSRDYILPISMDTVYYNSSEDEADSEDEKASADSNTDSRSMQDAVELSSRYSQSNVSSSKSASSSMTAAGYLKISNVYTPGSWLFQVFGYLSCIMATINYVLVLYAIVTLNNSLVIVWMQACMDIFFYVLVYTSVHQGYFNKRGEMILSLTKCRKYYHKRPLEMWSDIIANIPLQGLGLLFDKTGGTLYMMNILLLNKLLRVKYIIQFYYKTSAQLTNNLTLLQAIMTVLVAVLATHTMTCMWLLAVTAQTEQIPVTVLKMTSMDVHASVLEWNYTTALFVIATSLTATGEDKLPLQGLWCQVITGLSFISGKVLAAVIISTFIQISHATKHAMTRYEENNGTLIDVLKNQGLSSYQLKRFWLYIKQLWSSDRGRQLPLLLAQTPYVRRCDLMSAMFGQHLRSCFLFAETGEAFLRQLTVVLNYNVFFPGNYIAVSGNSESAMYWVNSGTVAVVSVRADLTETTHEYLYNGDMFGLLQGLHKGLKHCFSYRAETKVTIISLNLDSWNHILPFFPEAQKIINDRSEKLFTQNTIFM